MINLLIILVLLLLLFFIYSSNNFEKFHEKTNQVSNDKPEVIKDCESCSYCNFNDKPTNSKPRNNNSSNSKPETKEYIISRCLMQHTIGKNKDVKFKPENPGCIKHKELAYKSGCNKAINHFLQNIEAMKNVNDKENEKCSCVYSQDSKTDNPEKQSYNSWIDSF